MRLVCPNCGAQYEVGDDVIPQDGRDVECSNCAHTWFEQPGASAAAENGDDIAPPMPEPEPEQISEPDAAPVGEPEPDSDTVPDTPTATKPPRTREMAPEVADILRQEAAYEQAARRDETGTLETQPDLGLSQNPVASAQDVDAKSMVSSTDDVDQNLTARDDPARQPDIPSAVGIATSTVAVASAPRDDAPPRRDLLPDIEEINSTLRQDSARPAPAPDVDPDDDKNNFGRGFMLAVVIALVALAAYVFAPQISAAVPEIEQALTAYVEWVDRLRLWFDARMQSLAEAFAPELVS